MKNLTIALALALASCGGAVEPDETTQELGSSPCWDWLAYEGGPMHDPLFCCDVSDDQGYPIEWSPLVPDYGVAFDYGETYDVSDCTRQGHVASCSVTVTQDGDARSFTGVCR